MENNELNKTKACIKNIVYRGFLDSCNYSCSYCPFSKNKMDDNELHKDKNALGKFINYIKGYKHSVSVFLAPYGEALIHGYYMDAMIELSKSAHVVSVCIQTNNSFNIEDFMSKLKKENGCKEKITFWCSFHPSQISVEEFLSQCMSMYHYGIGFSVGAVGDNKAFDDIKKLRDQLPEEIYMWINPMDRMASPYSIPELNRWKSIDPLFTIDYPKAQLNACNGGKDNFFIKGNGDIYACNISRYKLGNIYKNTELKAPDCRSMKCSCYLAYCNRKDMNEVNFIGKSVFERRISPITDKIIFFDVDGTLTNQKGLISEETCAAVEKLAKENKIFLNTKLPVRMAQRKCRKIWKFISGGVFAGGGDIQIFMHNKNIRIMMQIDNCIIDVIRNNSKESAIYEENNLAYKVLIPCRDNEVNLYLRDLEKLPCNIMYEKGKLEIVSNEASKLNGTKAIGRLLGRKDHEIIVVGNGKADIEMLRYYKNSFSVLNSPEEVKAAARISAGIPELYSYIREM